MNVNEEPSEGAASHWAAHAVHEGNCPYPCPICTGIGIVKQMNPEVREHLIAAGREFLKAARALIESMAEEQRASSDDIQRIPLD